MRLRPRHWGATEPAGDLKAWFMTDEAAQVGARG